jgi:hypothetical protein
LPEQEFTLEIEEFRQFSTDWAERTGCAEGHTARRRALVEANMDAYLRTASVHGGLIMSQSAKVAAFAALAVVIASPASACGESLFRVGKGVSYREYQAPLPGNILMVASTRNERLVAEWLSHTGHNVQVVDDATKLSGFLKLGRFDVVLAAFKDRGAVEAQGATLGAKAKYLPIAAETAEDEAAARAQYKQALTTDSTPRDLLKAIHKTLKSDTNVKVGS